MNESTPVAVKWFVGSKGTVGVAKIKHSDDAVSYKISVVDGFMEKMDVLQVSAWGAEFPESAGKALFGGEDEK